MTCERSPWGYPTGVEYNNAVWFFVQSKYIMWAFVAEMVLILSSGKHRLLQALFVTSVVGLSLPSTIQYFHSQTRYRVEALSATELELMGFLQQGCSNGEVVLSGEKLAEHVVGLAPCRVPVLNPGTYTHLFVSRPALERREEDMASFWDAWREGEFRSDILERYAVEYVVVDSSVGDLVVDEDFASAGNGEEGREALTLVPSFENEHFVVTVWSGEMERLHSLAHCKKDMLASPF